MKWLLMMMKNILSYLPIILFCCCQNVPISEELYFKLNTQIFPSEGGSIALKDGLYKFNTVRTIHAKPNEGWIFVSLHPTSVMSYRYSRIRENYPDVMHVIP